MLLNANVNEIHLSIIFINRSSIDHRVIGFCCCCYCTISNKLNASYNPLAELKCQKSSAFPALSKREFCFRWFECLKKLKSLSHSSQYTEVLTSKMSKCFYLAFPQTTLTNGKKFSHNACLTDRFTGCPTLTLCLIGTKKCHRRQHVS